MDNKRKAHNPLIQLDDEAAIDPMAPEHRPEGWTNEDISFYFERALKVLNSQNFTTAPEFIDLLVNQCLAEKHWSDAFTHFLSKIKSMGIEVETNQNFYRGLSDKLFEWRTIRMMIHAAGLLRYEEEIMKYEIAKHYAPAPPMLPPPRVREVPVAIPKRAPRASPPRESILNPKPKPRQPPPARAPAAAKPKTRINKPAK